MSGRGDSMVKSRAKPTPMSSNGSIRGRTNTSVRKNTPMTKKTSTPKSHGVPSAAGASNSTMTICDISAIPTPNMNANVVLDGKNRSTRRKLESSNSKTVELLGEKYVAYNENLLAAAANLIQERESSELKNSIQSQLDKITKRLLTNQQTVCDLEKRLVDVKFLSETSRQLSEQQSELSSKLKDMEEAVSCTEKISSSLEPHLRYLPTKNLDLGPGVESFRGALSETVKLLDQMNVETSEVENFAETAENLSSVNRIIDDLDEQINKLHGILPVCQASVVESAAIKHSTGKTD